MRAQVGTLLLWVWVHTRGGWNDFTAYTRR